MPQARVHWKCSIWPSNLQNVGDFSIKRIPLYHRLLLQRKRTKSWTKSCKHGSIVVAAHNLSVPLSNPFDTSLKCSQPIIREHWRPPICRACFDCWISISIQYEPSHIMPFATQPDYGRKPSPPSSWLSSSTTSSSSSPSPSPPPPSPTLSPCVSWSSPPDQGLPKPHLGRWNGSVWPHGH